MYLWLFTQGTRIRLDFLEFFFHFSLYWMSIYVGVKYLNDKRFSLMFSFYAPSFNLLTYNIYWQPRRWWTGNSHQKECRMQRSANQNGLPSRTGFLKNSNFPWGLTTTSLHVLSYFLKEGRSFTRDSTCNLMCTESRSILREYTIFVEKIISWQKAW